MHCRYLGVVPHVVSAVTAWIYASNPVVEVAKRVTAMLSRRAQDMSAAAGRVTVYGLFLLEGPTLQGPHMRFVTIYHVVVINILSLSPCFAIQNIDIYRYLSIFIDNYR